MCYIVKMMLSTMFLMMISTASGQEGCVVVSNLELNCPSAFASWTDNSYCQPRDCNATLECVNGADFEKFKRDSCATTWANFDIQWESYKCYFTMTYTINEATETLFKNCSAYSIVIQSVENVFVGDPLEIHCSVNTADITNSDDVTVSWTGPNGATITNDSRLTITNDSRLTITNDSRLTITPTVSNGTNHISTLQFSYLSEDDEGLYECSTTVRGYNENKTASVEVTNFTIPTPNVIVTALNNQQVGDPLLLECNVTTVRGITSSVDIVWIVNDEEVGRVNNTLGEPAGNTVVYSNTYSTGSLLSEDDDDSKCQCYVEIDAVPIVNTFIINIQSMEDQILVGSPYEIACPIFASGEFNSTFTWTGPNGVITDDDRLTAVTSNISNDTTIFTSSLQFSYLSEDDEGSYRCDVTVFGYNNSTSSAIELTSFTVPTPNVTVTALNNQQVGDPLLLECNVTTVRGITSSVDIVWITNDTEVRRVSNVSGETIGNSVVYSLIYNDSEISLGKQDDGTMYLCSARIKTSTVLTASEMITLNVQFPVPTRTPGPSSGSNAAIIISSVAAMVTLTLAVAILGCFIYKRRSLSTKWSPPKTEYVTPTISFDADYPMIKPPPSTVESLDNEKVLHWIKDIQMPTIDEECVSIHSGETTNDDMLKCIYGKAEKSTSNGQERKNSINQYPYLSQSIFYSSDLHDSVNSSDDIQGGFGDYYCEDSTSNRKHDEHDNYQQTPSTSNGGSYIDYRLASLSHRGQQNQTENVPCDSTDESIFDVTKRVEDNDDMPYVAASVDTGVYSTSCFSDSSIPPPNEGYTSCSIAMYPVDNNTTPYIPRVTSPTSSHHNDKSMPFGDHNIQ